MRSLFDALAAAGATSLRVQRRLSPLPANPGLGGATSAPPFYFRLAKLWDTDLDFSRFTHDFHRDQLPARDPWLLGGAAARARLVELGAEPALDPLLSGMQQAGHEAVRLELHQRLGMRITTYVHSSAAGRNNGAHGLRAGGLRRHAPTTDEALVLKDGLNLSRAMSFKNAHAGLPFGGCKLTAQCADFEPATYRGEPSTLELERLGFLAWVIDSGQLVTGPDMGFDPALIDCLRRHFTGHMVCGPGARLGHTGAPTARGVFRALEAAARARFGERGLSGKTLAIQGLGSVGSELARWAHGAGAQLMLCDIEQDVTARISSELAGSQIFDAQSFPFVRCDVLAPCAFGGLFDEAAIPRLECQLIYGGANNQLCAATPGEEMRLSRLLAERGILTQPDWTYTMGGVLTGFEEYLHPEPSIERVNARIDAICGDGTQRLLRAAEAAQLTPTEYAYRSSPCWQPSYA